MAHQPKVIVIEPLEKQFAPGFNPPTNGNVIVIQPENIEDSPPRQRPSNHIIYPPSRPVTRRQNISSATHVESHVEQNATSPSRSSQRNKDKSLLPKIAPESRVNQNTSPSKSAPRRTISNPGSGLKVKFPYLNKKRAVEAVDTPSDNSSVTKKRKRRDTNEDDDVVLLGMDTNEASKSNDPESPMVIKVNVKTDLNIGYLGKKRGRKPKQKNSREERKTNDNEAEVGKDTQQRHCGDNISTEVTDGRRKRQRKSKEPDSVNSIGNKNSDFDLSAIEINVDTFTDINTTTLPKKRGRPRLPKVNSIPASKDKHSDLQVNTMLTTPLEELTAIPPLQNKRGRKKKVGISVISSENEVQDQPIILPSELDTNINELVERDKTSPAQKQNCQKQKPGRKRKVLLEKSSEKACENQSDSMINSSAIAITESGASSLSVIAKNVVQKKKAVSEAFKDINLTAYSKEKQDCSQTFTKTVASLGENITKSKVNVSDQDSDKLIQPDLINLSSIYDTASATLKKIVNTKRQEDLEKLNKFQRDKINVNYVSDSSLLNSGSRIVHVENQSPERSENSGNNVIVLDPPDRQIKQVSLLPFKLKMNFDMKKKFKVINTTTTPLISAPNNNNSNKSMEENNKNSTCINPNHQGKSFKQATVGKKQLVSSAQIKAQNASLRKSERAKKTTKYSDWVSLNSEDDEESDEIDSSENEDSEEESDEHDDICSVCHSYEPPIEFEKGSDVANFELKWIDCDSCHKWFHWFCVGIFSDDEDTDFFKCKICKYKQ